MTRHYITIEPVSIHNSVFGSAPDTYWAHGDFSTAFVDGFPKDWKCGEDTDKRHPDDYQHQYLKVHCHDQTDNGDKCATCAKYGWMQTTHRLYYRREHFKRCLCVRLGQLRGKWHWIVTWRKHRK